MYDGYVHTRLRACDRNLKNGGENTKYISGLIQLLKRKQR